jgi:xylulokinase
VAGQATLQVCRDYACAWRLRLGQRYLVGIDIGTQGSKGVLVDSHGRVVASRVTEHGISLPHSGWVEQDADVIWWADFCEISRSLIVQSGVDPHRVAGVGLSTIGPTLLLLDDEGRPLRPGILYADTRGDSEVSWLEQRLSAGTQRNPVGRALSSRLMSIKLLWLQRNEPRIWSRVRRIVTAQGYLVHKLTGQAVIDIQTARSFYPLFDLEKQDWSDSVGQLFGVAGEQLPSVSMATAVVGEVTPAAASATGLAPGTPVIAGTMDAYSGWLAAATVAEGDACAIYGSTLCVAALTPHKVIHPGVFSGAYLIPDTKFVGGATVAAGALTRWFRDEFGAAELDAQNRLGISAYQLLSMQAEEIPPGSSGLVVLPYFAGERSPIHDGNARGVIFGLTLQHTRNHIYRSLLESIAYSLRHILDTLASAGVEVTQLTATGGGANSDLLLQICSDVTGIPHLCRQDKIGAALGDAFLAGVAVGIIDSYSDLPERWNPITRVIQPVRDRSHTYDACYRIYRALYEQTKDQMHSLASLVDQQTVDGESTSIPQTELVQPLSRTI